MNRSLVLLFLSACTCGGESSEPGGEDPPAPAAEAATLTQYFPSAAGDRWRYANGDERVTRAVTASDDGRVIIQGEDRTAPLRLGVSDDAVTILDVEGNEAGRLLDTPIEVGHRWEYTVGDVACEARYAAVDDEFRVAGLIFNACLVVNRRCLHPEGKPFAEETVEQHAETYCPFVGRVREEIRLDPSPSADMALHRDDRLVFYRVGGAPAPLREGAFGCDSFLLSLTDVHAACGPTYRAAPVQSDDGRCVMTFNGRDSSLTLDAHTEAAAPLENSTSEPFVTVGEVLSLIHI